MESQFTGASPPNHPQGDATSRLEAHRDGSLQVIEHVRDADTLAQNTQVLSLSTSAAYADFVLVSVDTTLTVDLADGPTGLAVPLRSGVWHKMAIKQWTASSVPGTVLVGWARKRPS